jgi:hypothetical protein
MPFELVFSFSHNTVRDQHQIEEGDEEVGTTGEYGDTWPWIRNELDAERV